MTFAALELAIKLLEYNTFYTPKRFSKVLNKSVANQTYIKTYQRKLCYCIEFDNNN